MSRTWIAGFFFLTLTAVSCKEEKPPIPAVEMAPIIAEMHLADALSAMVSTDTPRKHNVKNDDSLAVWTTQILAKHHKTLEEFNTGMKWYRDRPKELDSLYGMVIPLLEKERRPR